MEPKKARIEADPSEYEHMTQKMRMTLGYPYDCLCDELAVERHASRKLIREFNTMDENEREKCQKILTKVFHPASASDFHIKPGLRVDYGFNVKIGQNCHISYNACLLDVSPITIGKNFKAGPNLHIYTASHPLDPMRRRSLDFGLPVTIGDNCVVGGMCVICPGITIHNNCVIEHGSVVTKDIPDNCVVAGRPARVIRTLADDDDYCQKNKEENGDSISKIVSETTKPV